MGDQVIAAIITGVVAAGITAPVTVLVGWLSYQGAIKKIAVDIRAFRENSIRDIRAKRIDAFAQFWAVLQENVNDTVTEGRTLDRIWLQRFVRDLNACHAQHGVLLPQNVYLKFCEFRALLLDIARKTPPGGSVSNAQMLELDKIWSGVHTPHTPGLATLLKDELASYERTAFSRS